jgi:hypothetical protein
MPGRAIVACSAEGKRGRGGNGRRGGSIGPRSRAERNAMGRAGVTGSVGKPDARRRKKQFLGPRGSSLENFLLLAAIGLAATNASCAEHAAHGSVSARGRAGGRWNGFGNVSGVGEALAGRAESYPRAAARPAPFPQGMSQTYCSTLRQLLTLSPMLRWAEEAVVKLE